MKRKSLTYLLTVLMSMVGANAYAHDIAVANSQGKTIYYNFISNNSELEVSFPGASSPTTINSNYTGTVVIPETVTYNGVTYPVTSIGNSAFKSCSSLTSVEIPTSVTSIGQYAFGACSGLTSVEIPNSVTSIGASAFASCRSLTSVVIPNSVTSIGNGAFFYSGLTLVEIGNSVTSIGEGAFNECSRLNKVIVEDIAAWCNISFANDRANPLYYAHHLYSDENTEITDLVIPNSVTSISNKAFSDCSGLTSVEIPNSVTSIGNNTFENCSGLEKVIVRDLAAWCNISFGNSVGQVYANPLYCAHHLYSDENTEITDLVIPNSVTSIGGCAFAGCSGLTSVEIPNSVTSIGDGAFYQCSGLTSVEIGYSVTSIGVNAFSGCSSLTSVVIPNSVTNIGSSAFYGCSSLTDVTVEKETPLTISSNVFSNRGNATLFVPIGSKAAYESAQYWQDFSLIKEVILFADANVKNICVSHWDTNNDGELCISEAAAVTSLSDYFKNNTSITSFDELAYFTGLTSIGQAAFYNCSGLTSVEIPNSVTSIGVCAFQNCSGLTSITIPNSVTSIGEEAFFACTALTGSLEIPNSVTTIGQRAFGACGGGLTSIVVSSGNTNYDSRGDCNAIIETASNKLILGCNNTVIPNNVTNIGEEAFYGCSGLTSVTIPNGVTSIGDYAFYGCSSLTSVEIPNSVTSFGSLGVFGGCTNLTSMVVSSGNTKYDSRGNCNAIIQTSTNQLISGCKNTVIPNSVTSILSYAFLDCSGLTSVVIPNSVMYINSDAFQGCSGLTSIKVMNKEPISIYFRSLDYLYSRATLYVPVGSKTKYQNAQYWSNFTTIEEFYPTVTISSAGVGTYCSEYALDFTGSAVKAYIVSAFTPSTGQVILTRVYDVPEQTGLVVLADNAGDYQIPMGQGATIVSNMLVGVIDNTQLNKVDGDYTNYVLAKKSGNLGFYAVMDGSTLGAHKAYLPLLTASLANLPSSAPQLSLIFDDEGTTGITTTDNGQLMMDNVYYDLSGRRVENPAHGLYIVNGKKVFIK